MNKDEKYLKGMKKQGLIKICLAVPEESRVEIMAYAKLLRSTYRTNRTVISK